MPLALAVVLAIQVAAPIPIGVGVGRADRVCAVFQDSTLSPGTPVTVVDLDAADPFYVASEPVVRGVIESPATADDSRSIVALHAHQPFDPPATACDWLAMSLLELLEEGSFYWLRMDTPGFHDRVWIVFAGDLPTGRTDAGEVTVHLDDARPEARLRTCTSSEGMHLTLWSGTPLESERLWRTYYYFGYDVVPTCDDRDFR